MYYLYTKIEKFIWKKTYKTKETLTYHKLL